MQNNIRVLLPDGSGLAYQNILARLKANGYTNIIVRDKHGVNISSALK